MIPELFIKFEDGLNEVEWESILDVRDSQHKVTKMGDGVLCVKKQRVS